MANAFAFTQFKSSLLLVGMRSDRMSSLPVFKSSKGKLSQPVQSTVESKKFSITLGSERLSPSYCQSSFFPMGKIKGWESDFSSLYITRASFQNRCSSPASLKLDSQWSSDSSATLVEGISLIRSFQFLPSKPLFMLVKTYPLKLTYRVARKEASLVIRVASSRLESWSQYCLAGLVTSNPYLSSLLLPCFRASTSS